MSLVKPDLSEIAIAPIFCGCLREKSMHLERFDDTTDRYDISWKVANTSNCILGPVHTSHFCRVECNSNNRYIMKQIISLSIVSIAFDTAEMRRMNRALIYNVGSQKRYNMDFL